MISEQELKKEVRKSSQRMKPWVQYIRNDYMDDLYICFKKAMSVIKRVKPAKPTKSGKYRKHRKPDVIIMDLDETFMQNASFAPHILELWSEPQKSYFLKLSKLDIGPILPFMRILYDYLIFKKIEVIFLTGRRENLRELTNKNLRLFGIEKYQLYMCPVGDNSYSFKKRMYYALKHLKHVVLVLNDQDEIQSKRLIKFPQLYKVNE